MATASKSFTRDKRSRLGNRNYKSPPPLRFTTVRDAKTYIKANKLKVTEHHLTAKGIRIQTVDRKTGKPRTISIEVTKR